MTYIGSLSGSSSSGSSSTQNTGSISGLASGINTDAIVNALVQGAQAPLVSQLQQRQVLQWKQENYQQVNTALNSLQSSLSNLRLQSTFLAQQTSSSNSSLITATSNGLAANGTYSVAVSQLAQGATLSSASALSTDPNYGNTTLAQLAGNPLGANSTSTSVGLTVNGKAYTFNPQTDTINSILQTLSTDPASGVTAFYDANAGKVVMQTTATGSSAQIQVSSDTAGLFQNVFQIPPAAPVVSTAFPAGTLSAGGVVEINGQKLSFTAGQSISSVATAINQVTNATGVTATANTTSQTLTLAGSSLYSPISISDPSGILQMASSPATAAQDATYSVSGVSSSSPNNNPVFNGVTLNLQGVTGANPVSVTVSSNTTGIVQAVTGFVQQYNQTLQTMQGLYNQQRNFSYQPLTSAQESQMTQAQVDQWNQKAQSGMLGFDPLLGDTMNTLESAANTIVTGLTGTGGQAAPNSLSSIGISPISPMNGISPGSTTPGVTTTGWNTYGLLQINTAQLTAAVQANPQGVMNLFTNSGVTAGTTNPTQQGLAVQMYNSVTSSISQVTQEAGLSVTPLPTTPNSNTGSILLPSTGIDPNGDLTSLFSGDANSASFLGQQISAIDSRSQKIQTQISSQRQIWLNQFVQMEQAIQQMNSQSSQLIGMLGSVPSTSSSSSSGTTGH